MPDSLAFCLADVSRLMRKRFDGAARDIGITGPQWRVLFLVRRDPGINQGQLADQMDVEPITTCRMVDRLEAATLIERRRDPGDRRAWQLFVTPDAMTLITQAETIADSVIGTATIGLDGAEQAQLAALLGRLRDNLLDDARFETREKQVG
ncbi:MarR family winged helix-turn-helix transcriptional regulator [Sphingobium aromaticiconvertens]|uniref:MarR family winged helix-turn-helix transcriptional regulator n=1 Tax=Sphingobium aromaticiconvertens TaxID=365341 RepID=UPI00301AC92F